MEEKCLVLEVKGHETLKALEFHLDKAVPDSLSLQMRMRLSKLKELYLKGKFRTKLRARYHNSKGGKIAEARTWAHLLAELILGAAGATQSRPRSVHG